MDNPASLGELIDTRACDHGEQPFLIDVESGRVVEYADLQSKVRAVAAFVASRGVEPGQSVAYAMHNGYVCAITILGLLYGGYRAVAVNLVAGRDVIAYVLSHSEAALVLTQAEHEGLIGEALRSDVFTRADRSDKTAGKGLSGVEAGPPLVLLDEALLDDIMDNGSAGEFAGKPRQASPGNDVDCPVDGQTDGVLMYTSGTTGRPKGVVLSHGNLLAGGRNVVLAHGLTSSD
ncbi:MAG: acyl--CoA ligase, partial [Granulosicoccus sp.]|nr:acyl--CoA ligase [Granulosicoccus sp.]